MSVLDELFLFADASNLKPPSVGVAIDSDLDFLEDPPGASDLEVLQQPSGSGGQPQLPFFLSSFSIKRRYDVQKQKLHNEHVILQTVLGA